MKQNFPKSKGRRRGMSLIELAVSVSIIGIAIAGISEVLWVNATWANRINNKLDNIYDAKLFLERFGRDVRMALNVGAINGGVPSLTYSAYGATFDMSVNPNTTVILQLPVFDTNLAGTPLTPGFQTTSGGTPVVDTLIYQVVPDPSDPTGRLQEIQYSVVPGIGSTRPALAQQVVLKGLVGPIYAGSTQLATFQYVDKVNGPASTFTVFQPQMIPQISGIVCTIELQNSGQPLSTQQLSSFGLRAEVFLRNNVTP